MRKLLLIICLIINLGLLPANAVDWKLVKNSSDLSFKEMPKSWDEGVPLGNSTVGMLVWERDNNLRFSLDRVDLWDLRQTDSLSGPNYRFDWVKQHIRENNYLPVQKKLDWPYDNNAAPSKIPGAALEFSVKGKVKDLHLYIKNALCRVEWENGVVLHTFVKSTGSVGWFVFENVPTDFKPELIAPRYEEGNDEQTNPVTGQDLQRLGYKQGKVETTNNKIVYHQKGYGDFYYDVVVEWRLTGSTCMGVWSIESSMAEKNATEDCTNSLSAGVENEYERHLAYWNGFWNKSSICLPDEVLQKQYDNEMYKLGSVARNDSYPISLQAVWTADNGKLPPWKGDYHHDLNTQLSYWPVYAGNHLDEGMGYLNTLWNQRDVYRQFTKTYFGKDGLNVPGVTTLTGDAMGGWIQYSMSQTTAAWLSQHYYLQWKYSDDDKFLKDMAYPFVREAAVFLQQQLIKGNDGYLKLEYSSSPEIFDNSIQAWFSNFTNYDLSLTRFLFKAATEMAEHLKLKKDAKMWQGVYSQLPDFNLDENGSLTFAKGTPYNQSHRHFSHAMAIFPLGLIDWEDGEKAQNIITNTINTMEKVGPDWWTGYSYAWFACMKARARDGEGAARYLSDFANCFCSPNTFHVNGDQSGTGKSKYEYRPFTLEGNFAFAKGVQEMLMQSHTGTIMVFPAIPKAWKNVSFTHLRAQGAFLVSARMENGVVTSLKVYSENGNKLRIVSPKSGKIIERNTRKGETIIIK